ncbi:macoilin [Uranotaenia lowii]|uniref:macoilin n=1 Tax=Uranotaenia lowii TaxID=190385 RepID=UPI002479217E|nr:macoilin [Uranotaenia lowii]XP_055594913.1 macoilin [Uranotaenia lowii]XP_055594914.1 macoilin [Uranotaenia lowii]
MKRRNADCGKIRRPIKRNKIAEQIGSNTLLYVKFLLLWAFVITADFLLEFRFEFLWPFWLLLRSVYDSFKYKGLAFSVLFVCIAITSDLVCLFFIPVQWLFFAASTYVWVQYVWHTDKGICLPTIILWILFVYLEAAIRWKDSRNIPHLDLCRPFAAHCIGYPVVTLGFGFKSYVGYRIRQRKQREVAKDNDFYMQLLQEALPKEESAATSATSTDGSSINTEHQDHQLSPVNTMSKELSVTALQSSSNSSNSSSGAGNGPGGGSNHHHHNHHSSKNSAQSHNKAQVSNAAVTGLIHAANGHAGSGASISSNSSSSSGVSGSIGTGGSTTMNGGMAHSKQLHRKSLDKDGSGSLSGKAQNYSYHSSSNAKESSRSSVDSSHTNGAAMSPKEKKDCDSSGLQKSTSETGSSGSSSSQSKSNHANSSNSNDSNHHDSVGAGGGGGGKNKHQQNGHVVNYDMELHQNHVENDPPVVEPKPSRSGRKNRIKQKENANNLAAVRLAATLALASSISTLTTTAASASTVTTSTMSSMASSISSSSSTTSSTASKDNHLSEQEQQRVTTTSSGNNTQSNGSNVAATSASVSSAAAVPSVPVVVTVKVCEGCSRMEADAKKLRSELGAMRQSEHELRQKYDSANANLKQCLQGKQKENEELQNKFQELQTQRQQERQNMQTVERRLGDERRHRQSLESQLQNERKHRKLAEEKAAGAVARAAECGDQCKVKRQQMEMEIQSLRVDLINSEDAKHNAEKQNRSFEQEMRKFEVQLRNRESQQSAEVLMSALAAMQDKNNTLEKNLSAETRVKLDLFSALGDARRQLEIATCSLRTKEKEILDLKAKIVQLLAVMPAMPNDALCLTGPGPSAGGNGGGSLMRLVDAPQLLPHPALNGLPSATGGQQPSPMSHLVMNNPPLISQLSNLNVLTSTITTTAAGLSGSTSIVAGAGMMQQAHPQQQSAVNPGLVAAAAAVNGQIVQMQNSNNCPSNLDPNASVYTPKNCSSSSSSMVGGTEA